MSKREPAGTLRLRLAKPSDLPALIALEQRSFSGDRLSARQFRHHVFGRGRSVLLVAARGDTLLGNAMVFFRAGAQRARLYSIVVAHDARGLGLGERLLARVEREARLRGARELALEVRQDNAAAIALYERLGYARCGEKPSYYEDGAPAWRYLKRLL